MTSSGQIFDLDCKELQNILREFRYFTESENERYITLKSDHLTSYYKDLIITLPNRKIIAGPIIESALKQGNISRQSFIEKMKGITTISSRESIVAHVDILGFKSLIQEAKEDISKFDEILNKYNRALKNAFSQVQLATEDRRRHDWRCISHVRVYTDNLLFVSELDTDGDGKSVFWQTLEEIAFYQLNLALEGYFTRGVLFVERSYADEILVFSPALLHAEEYEKKANYPRVILEGSALARVKDYLRCYSQPKQCPFNEMLLVDQDDQWFINYLYILYCFSEDMVQRQMGANDGSPASQSPYYPEAIDELYRHRDNILENLNKFTGDPGIYQKYQWLANYHNYCCKTYFPADCSAQINDIEESILSPCFSCRE